jgi:hypothetical protein
MTHKFIELDLDPDTEPDFLGFILAKLKKQLEKRALRYISFPWTLLVPSKLLRAIPDPDPPVLALLDPDPDDTNFKKFNTFLHRFSFLTFY